MFENLRAAFREAVENFNRELNRDEVPEAVDRLLYAMRDEVTEAKTRLHDLEAAIEKARDEARREAAEEETCRRREEMARGIGDEETARIAAEYGDRHAERKTVLTRKAAALEEELRLRSSEIEDMLDKIREARKNRDTLAATLGRWCAPESHRESDDLFDELDRMAEKIGGDDARRAAEESLDFDATDFDAELGIDEPTRPAVDIEEQLAELKRRMGKDRS